ncbi:Uncharacterised protein [Mycobacteroides abscessus subsp. abscessus]|nr:Uncharacterised protein [Mycobacteroides abscessus subsp. abscessus]
MASQRNRGSLTPGHQPFCRTRPIATTAAATVMASAPNAVSSV